MGSFSDAHETLEIPIIAANLHQVVLPRQCQVWAVLRHDDTLRRLDYSLAATFLGRVAISGDLATLSEAQMERLRDALAFYRLAAPVIADGRSRLFREIGESWRDPIGWQVLRRVSADGQRILCVAHAFARPPAEPIRVPLPAGRWRIVASFGDVTRAVLEEGTLTLAPPEEFTGNALLLELEAD